jgi:uncharacterized protein (DUF1015 family)
MARIFPFQPYRYTPAAGPLANLVTQPYDKISPPMQARYLSLSPHNLVRIILGPRFDTDTDSDNVYRRAADLLWEWIDTGVLAKETSPGFYAYFQEFTVPDTGEKLTRKGFIGLGAIEEYSAGVVHRHEQTLSGPKKDRMELLRHTHAHFGQIFMLYPDPERVIDGILDQAAAREPDATIQEDYDKAVHRLWRISDPAQLAAIQNGMDGKKLLIADGHHRYETALRFGSENPHLPGADRVMMTFVNMHSPGLKILATHRLVHGLPNFDPSHLLASIPGRRFASLAELKPNLAEPAPDRIRIGVAVAGSPEVVLFDRARKPGELDVRVLHEELLGGVLGISEEAVREEKNLHYVRGVDSAIAALEAGSAQAAFLLEPTTIAQVADVAFSGGVMPQKSTDFFPKLLSGLTIYKID